MMARGMQVEHCQCTHATQRNGKAAAETIVPQV